MRRIILAIAYSFPLVAFAQLADSATRLVHLQGAVNFRDVGGYKTANGKEVVTGKVFRSANISKLTGQDLQVFADKKIHTVIDFRGVKEAAAAPDKLPANTDYTLSSAGSDSALSPAQMAAEIKQGTFLTKFYGAENVQYFGQRYKPLFDKMLVLPDTAAIIYHCTLGRDRTGMATALFLYALGVPQAKIEEDYTASNVYLASMNDRMYGQMSKGTGMSLEEVQKQMELRPELLRIFFSAITEKYGTVEVFMDKELGVGKKQLKKLRKMYTH